VWTLGGPSRAHRIGSLWEAWLEAGAHIVEDGWTLPSTGMPAFTESGTYAPSFRVGPFTGEDGTPQLLICDGYAATAEAMQAASLDPVLGLHTSMALFSSHFEIPWDREAVLMRLDPDGSEYPERLAEVLGRQPDEADLERYRDAIRDARDAEVPVGHRTLTADDLFPEKRWRVLALASFMLPDPYTGAPGVETVGPDTYRVTTHAATRHGIVEVALTLRLMEPRAEMQMVFSPLLDRFYAGQDFRERPVKVSDSGRIRNELQTLASEAIEYLPGDRMQVRFDTIDDAVLPPDKKTLIQEVLAWYKQHHPVWFRWLEL
jgi:hypothetical protein